MFLSYRNQLIDLLCQSMDWFLYYRDLRHESGNFRSFNQSINPSINDQCPPHVERTEKVNRLLLYVPFTL